MKNNPIHINLVLCISLGIIIVIVIYLKSLFSYLTLGNNPQPEKVCEEKKVNWGKNTYLIDSLSSGDKLVIKVVSLYKDAWYTLLKPVSSPQEEFKTCVKGVKHYPNDLITRSQAGKELQARSKGVAA